MTQYYDHRIPIRLTFPQTLLGEYGTYSLSLVFR